MNTDSTYLLTVGEYQVQVVRKDIKHLHLSVCPPDGHLRIAAPHLLHDEALRMAVITRLPWIKRQQKAFLEQPRQSQREYVSGETHYFEGRGYRLEVLPHEGRPYVRLRNKEWVSLHVAPDSDAASRHLVMQDWYRRELKALLPALIAKWEERTGFSVAAWGVKRMKTKWGSCQPEAGRIWLNLELMKKPRHCLEYVILHEIAHFHERNHNERFQAFLTQHMPLWRSYREELNRTPLAAEVWRS